MFLENIERAMVELYKFPVKKKPQFLFICTKGKRNNHLFRLATNIGSNKQTNVVGCIQYFICMCVGCLFIVDLLQAQMFLVSREQLDEGYWLLLNRKRFEEIHGTILVVLYTMEYNINGSVSLSRHLRIYN